MVIVSRVDAHSGARNAVLAESYPRRNCFFFEGPVVFVEIELVRLSVIRQKNVRPAIAVVIEDGDAETLRSVIKKVGLLSGVFKLSIAQVVPKARARSLVRFRRAVGLMGAIEGAEQITLDRPLHIIGDHQI